MNAEWPTARFQIDDQSRPTPGPISGYSEVSAEGRANKRGEKNPVFLASNAFVSFAMDALAIHRGLRLS